MSTQSQGNQGAQRTDERDINAARREGTALGRPAKTVLEDPRVKVLLLLLGQAQARIGNALQDVVVVLRRPEDAW